LVGFTAVVLLEDFHSCATGASVAVVLFGVVVGAVAVAPGAQESQTSQEKVKR
jgi:hypothetical protein